MRGWTYVIATGALIDPDGAQTATGYAGRGPGLNNSSMQDVHDIGPLPVGYYRCGAPVYHTRLGPDAIPLIPFASNPPTTRGGFYVHADNAARDRSASEGCIVIGDAAVRARLAEGTVIEVVADGADASA